MKNSLRNLLLGSLSASALLVSCLSTPAQAFTVDPGASWVGFMNVYDISGGGQGGYLWGSPWGAADLRAVTSGSVLTLSPNINCYNPTDPYWVNPDGSGAKWMEASYYVDKGTALGGQTVEFSGLTLGNTLVSPYASVAVIKEFTASYGFVGMTTASLVGGNAFDITRAIAAGDIVQYGFMTTGPVANPATADSLGWANVQVVPEPSSLALLGFGAAAALAFRRRQ